MQGYFCFPSEVCLSASHSLLQLRSCSECDPSLLGGHRACRCGPISTEQGSLLLYLPLQVLTDLPCATLPASCPHILLGQKDMRASENRTQKCCPVFNSMVSVPPSEVWHLRTHKIPPSQTNKQKNNNKQTSKTVTGEDAVAQHFCLVH